MVLIQSFGGGIFNYPLPYTYASVYGSLAACLFLLYADRGAFNPTKINLLWAGLWSAAALLMKLEFGLACFGSLAVLQVGLILRQRSWHAAFMNLLTVTPALAICAVVIWWMISIGGVAFITQENLMSWPTSYFMQKYGRYWLADAWVRFFIVRVTESHRNNCWLRGFLGRVSFLANIDFLQTVASRLLYSECPRDWHGCVLDGNNGTISADIAMLVFRARWSSWWRSLSRSPGSYCGALGCARESWPS